MQRSLETCDRLSVTLSHGLHSAVLQIPYVACDPLSTRDVFREEPEPHALNQSADEIASGDHHCLNDRNRDYSRARETVVGVSR